MAKNVLPVDFQDDILTEDMDGRRRYQMITNADGTVSFVDVTEYTQVGSNFGQAQINATNEAVNESADKNKIIDSKEDLLANTQAGMMAGALAVKEIRSELNENMQNRFKIMKFQLPADTTANTKVYTATESDLMDYFPVGISTYVQSDTDAYWINNAEHVQQVLLRADGIYITLKSTYLVNQWARLLLCRYPT